MKLPNEKNVVVLIMAGGVGSRLWPISSKEKPKQFCHLVSDDETMIQSIVELAESIVSADRIFVSTCSDYVPLVESQVPHLNPDNIIQEPAQRGTTASIALSSLYIKRKHPEATVVLLSSDCVIQGKAQFIESIRDAVRMSRLGNNLVSVGVNPTEPHTGYGYMKCGTELSPDCFEGVAYIEKPDRSTAVELLAEGGYFWNAGIFVWHVDVICQAIRKFVPASKPLLTEIESLLNRSDHQQVAMVYENFEDSAIDCAVMEKITADCEFSNVLVKGCFYWTDLGSYKSWKDYVPSCRNGNAIVGDVITEHNPNNCILVCESPYQVRVGQISDMIVSVCSKGNVLILPIDQDQNIKALLGEHRARRQQKGFLINRHSDSPSARRTTGGYHHAIENTVVGMECMKGVRITFRENEVRVNC